MSADPTPMVVIQNSDFQLELVQLEDLEDQTMSKCNVECTSTHLSQSLSQVSIFQPQAVLISAQPSGSGQPLNSDSEMQVEVTPQFEIPSFDFDLDLFSQMFEQEPIPEPTDAELAAHAFLRKVLRK